MPTELLTTEQAAVALGISVARVKQLLAKGKLKGIHVGKQWIIERAALADVRIYGKAGRPTKTDAAKKPQPATRKTNNGTRSDG